MAQQVINFSQYKRTIPLWVNTIVLEDGRRGFVAVHPAKNVAYIDSMASGLGVDVSDEGSSAVLDYGVIMSRLFGFNAIEVAALMLGLANAMRVDVAVCCRAVRLLGVEEKQRDALLINTSLSRAVSAAEYSWSQDQTRGQLCHGAFAAVNGWLKIIRLPNWRHHETVMQLVTVLIEAVRLESGGHAYDVREARAS